jgi:hypothetical protein
VDAVLPQPALPRHLPPVAIGRLEAGRRRRPHSPTAAAPSGSCHR